MATSATAPPPQTPRAKHRYSKSAAHATNDDSDNQSSSRTRQGRRQNAQAQRQPEWHDAAVAMETGDFDANGNFVSAPVQNGSVNNPVESPITNSASSKKSRRPPKAKNPIQAASQPRIGGSRSPSGQIRNSLAPTPAGESPCTKAEAAYAGASFHASPAASSLPIPKFFSKSVPAASSQSGLQARLEQDRDADKSDESPPPTRSSAEAADSIPMPIQSPLDFFFKADREEKARQSIGSNTSQLISSDAAISSPEQPNHWTQIYGVNQKRHSRHASGGSDKAMFMMELDGTPQRPNPTSPEHFQNRSVAAPSVVPRPQVVSPRENFHFPSRQQLYSAPHYGNSMPMLHQVRSGPHSSTSSGYRSDEHNGSPFVMPRSHDHGPRSAGSTPAPQPTGVHQNNQNLHYGNRNLSPLFRAVRSPGGNGMDVRRTSTLRQELSANHSPKVHSNEFSGPAAIDTSVVNSGNDMLARLKALQPKAPSSDNETQQAALNYLHAQVKHQDQTKRGSTPARNGVLSPPIDRNILSPNSIAFDAPFDGSPLPKKPVPPAFVAMKDVESMEHDLRRLLNLTGSSGSGTR